MAHPLDAAVASLAGTTELAAPAFTGDRGAER